LSKQAELGGDFVRLLASILDESKLTEIEYETDGVRIRVAREKTVVNAPVAAPVVSAAPSPVQVQEHIHDVPVSSENSIKSPIVGTAYRSSSPSDPAFVEVGSVVKEGDTLLIIEAMKVMNPLKSSRSGVVKKILVGDGAPVEYGEILMVIE
jgi:acetyl-CoA carboxylase biotin carboxyl carrier protein